MGFNIPMNTGQPSFGAPTVAPAPAPAPAAMPASSPAPTPVVAPPINMMNAVSLTKNSGVSLEKNGRKVQTLRFGLGWDVIEPRCDLDASAFMLGADGRVIGNQYFVFYHKPQSPDGSITHSGDSDGSGMGDDEIITVYTNKIDPRVQKIVFTISVDQTKVAGFTFQHVSNAGIHIDNVDTNEMLVSYRLEDYGATKAMIVGELYRSVEGWAFKALGESFNSDLAGLCAKYGVQVA